MEVNAVTDVESITGWRANGIHDVDDRCCSNVLFFFSIFCGGVRRWF